LFYGAPIKVIGNESLHPGKINLKDDRETALSRFDLLDLIVGRKITQPNKIKGIYRKRPDPKKKSISRRDNER